VKKGFYFRITVENKCK